MKPSRTMTPERASIAIALTHVGMAQHDIAALLCCNQGRVSEAVTFYEEHGGSPANLNDPRIKYMLGSLLAQAVVRLSAHVGNLDDEQLADLFKRGGDKWAR